MNQIPMVRYRLGAEELIELGRVNAVPSGREPFLSNRPRVFSMGQPDAGSPPPEQTDGTNSFLAQALSKDLDILGNLVLISSDIMAKSEAVVFRTVGDLLDHAPSVDVLLAQIDLLGNAALKSSLPLPEKFKDGFENVLNGIANALSASGTSAQNQKAIDQAAAALMAQAGDLKDQVKNALDATGVSGDDLTPVRFAPEPTPATPPPAGVTGPSVLGSSRSWLVKDPVMLVLSRG
jgi:hypothetical protein